jgi:hypothetical protein
MGVSLLRSDANHFFKFATGAEPASYSWTFLNEGMEGEAVKAAGAILSFTCVDTTDPIVASSGNEGCSDTLTALEVYAEANFRLVAFYSIKKTDDIDLETPSGMTEIYDFRNPQDVTIVAAVENGVQISDGWTGDRVSYSGSSSDNKWVAQLIALR